MTLRVVPLVDDALQHHLGDLARLRISVFRDFPYLYDGDLDYERDYLSAFARSPNAVIVGAFDGEVLVGASTAAPLHSQLPDIVEPFRARRFSLNDYFYFGESVLDPRYRGTGIGVKFFEMRESHARGCHAKRTVFCAVVRDPLHPSRPAQYQPLDGFWMRRGYAPVRGFTCRLSWKEIGEGAESSKIMQFWTKDLH